MVLGFEATGWGAGSPPRRETCSLLLTTFTLPLVLSVIHAVGIFTEPLLCTTAWNTSPCLGLRW